MFESRSGASVATSEFPRASTTPRVDFGDVGGTTDQSGAATGGGVLRAAVGEAGPALGQAKDTVGEPGLIGQDDLVASLEGLVGLRAVAEPITLALVSEAIQRGLPDGVGLTARDCLGVLVTGHVQLPRPHPAPRPRGHRHARAHSVWR